MAFPRSIDPDLQGDFVPRAYRNGPFLSCVGAVYIFATGPTSVDDIELRMFKLSPPLETSDFVEQDTTNRPLTSSLSWSAASVVQEGDLLHIAVQENQSSAEPYYCRFDMATDTWVDIDGLGDREVRAATIANGVAGEEGIDIALLSTGRLRIVYQGQRNRVMGTDFAKVYAVDSVDNGKTWGTPVSIDDNTEGTSVDYTGGILVAPPNNSDQTHIFFATHSGSLSVYQRAMTEGGTLRTIRDTGVNTNSSGMRQPLHPGVGFDRGGTSKVRVLYLEETTNDLRVLNLDAFSDDSSPSFSSDLIDDDVGFATTVLYANLTVEPDGAVHCIFTDRSDDDVFTANDGAVDSWTTPVSIFAGTFSQRPFANVYVRDLGGGDCRRILGHCFRDGTGGDPILYDEDEIENLANCPTAFSITALSAIKDEGDSGTTTFTFTITRGGDLTCPASVDYAVTGSGANPANAADFGGTLPSGMVNFAALDGSEVLTILVSGDTDVEEDEGFTVTLSNPSYAHEITVVTALGLIQNDDVAVSADFFGPVRIDVAPIDVIEVAPDNIVVSEVTIGISKG